MLLQSSSPMAQLKSGKYPHQIAVNLDTTNYEYYSKLAEKDVRRLGEYLRIVLDKYRLSELEKDKPSA